MNKEGEDDEGPEELKVEREAPGLDQALRAFGQLGYVFEPDAGARWEGTPGVRNAGLSWKSRNAVKKSRQMNLSRKACRPLKTKFDDAGEPKKADGAMQEERSGQRSPDKSNSLGEEFYTPEEVMRETCLDMTDTLTPKTARSHCEGRHPASG